MKKKEEKIEDVLDMENFRMKLKEGLDYSIYIYIENKINEIFNKAYEEAMKDASNFKEELISAFMSQDIGFNIEIKPKK